MNDKEWEEYEHNRVCEKMLSDILGCGCLDLEKIISIIRMDEELFNCKGYETVFDNYKEDTGEFNSLLDRLMYEIVYTLADDLNKNYNTFKYTDIISEKWCNFLNYGDSWFQIECLDGWRSGTSKDVLLEEFKLELESW